MGKSRGRKANYVTDNQDKPVVGLSADSRGNYYNTHYRSEGIKRENFGYDDTEAIFKFLQWEAKRKGDTFSTAEKPDYNKGLKGKGSITFTEKFHRLIEQYDIPYKQIIEGIEVKQIDIPDSYVWDRARYLLLSNSFEAERKLNLPGIADFLNNPNYKEPLTLEEIGNLYFNRKLKPLKIQELTDSQRWWKQFCDIVNVDNVRQITLELINRYQQTIHKMAENNKYSPTYIQHRLDKIKTIFRNVLRTSENIDDTKKVLDYCLKFHYLNKVNTNPTPIDKDDFIKLLDAADKKLKAILLLSACCGLYPEDIADIKKTDIDLNKRTLIMYRKKTNRLRTANCGIMLLMR